MISIKIPGWPELQLEYLVLDYNGTLAADGHLVHEVKEKLNILAKDLSIHIITADTFGCTTAECRGINCTLHLMDNSLPGGPQKENLIQSLGPAKVVAMGNGANDAAMLANAALAIGILGDEGVCVQALTNADILVKSIVDALELLLKPKRLIATLRK